VHAVHYLEKGTMNQIGAPLVGTYDDRLVALSIFIAISASYAALDLGGRVTATRGGIRSAWLAGGATAMGFGIWSMHFTGMLAFSLRIPVAYYWPTVLLSLLAAILASAVALYVVSRRKMGRVQALTGSVLMGLGIAGMHYIGMAAMRLSAVCHFSPFLVAVSVFVAILASLAALMFTFDYREDFKGTTLAKVISAAVMGAAISLMHYIGMMSASFVPNAVLPDTSQAVSISALGLGGIGIGTLVVQGTAILTSAVDRRLAAQAQEVQTSEYFRQVADFLQDVLLLGNADLSQVLFVNRAYEAIWGRAVESLYRDARSWLEGVHPDDRQHVQNALRSLLDGERFDYLECRVVRPDGSISWVRLRARPVFDSQGHPYRIVGSFHEFTMRKRAEENVKQAENRIRLIINTIPTMVWTIQPNGTVDFVNQRWMDYTGLTLEEEVEDPTDVVHPEDLPRVMEKWLADMAAGQPSEDEMRLRRADGEYRWFLIRTAPLRDEQGNVIKWYGVSIDIEDRKQAESQARTLLDAIPQQIWSGPPDGTIDYCNERWRFDTGLGLEDVRDEGWLSIIHPDDRDLVLKAWHNSVANGTPYEQEERHKRADGTYRWFLSRGVPLRNPEGRVVRWYGTNTDIQDRKQAEEALRSSERQQRQIAAQLEKERARLVEAQEVAKIGSWEADLETLNVIWSEQTHRIFETDPSSFHPTRPKFREFIHPDDRAKVDEAFDASLNKRSPFTVEYRIVMPDGRVKILEEHWQAFHDANGKPVRVSGTCRDITERVRAEEELQRLSGKLLRLQDEARRKIARDLHDSTGQELVALATMLGQLRSSIPSKERKARRVLSECRALADKCIRDVRTLSYVLHPPALDAAGLGDAIRDYVKGFSKRTGIQVELELPPRIGRLARDIELVLFRVVQESLTNIQRHSGSQEAKIRVNRNSHLILEISDFGRGVSVFKKKGKEEARLEVGVGIPSMQERVKLVGGRLEIDSTDAGTSVRVTIPLERNERERTSHSDRR
jgi:PAS domain S-box-containing protein